MKNLIIILVLCFLNKSNVVFGQQMPLSENFETGMLNPIITMQTVGTFDSLPGIKNIPNFDSTKAFGFGVSTCQSNCFTNFMTSLYINFSPPILVDSLKWSEMELFNNWGSEGYIFLVCWCFLCRAPAW